MSDQEIKPVRAWRNMATGQIYTTYHGSPAYVELEEVLITPVQPDTSKALQNALEEVEIRKKLHMDFWHEVIRLGTALNEALGILEKADLTKVTDKLHWANVISEARVLIDKALSHPEVSEAKPSEVDAEAALEWLFKNNHQPDLPEANLYNVFHGDSDELIGEGATALSAIRSAMKSEQEKEV